MHLYRSFVVRTRVGFFFGAGLKTRFPNIFTIISLYSRNILQVLHAVLGCLRNLAVCQPARQRLLQLCLAEKAGELLVRLSDGQDQTVTGKLMSTLRLVSQDSPHTCRELGSDTELVRGETPVFLIIPQ